MKMPYLTKLLIIGIIVFSACLSQKQIRKDDYFYCDFVGESAFDVKEFRESVKSTSKTDDKIDTLLKKITNLSFPYRGFDLIEDKSGNVRLIARAVIEKKSGYRYILYNKNKLLSIDLNNPESEAAILGVLAHEVAHLNFGHTTSNHKFELIADTYSGWVQKKLGISRGKCILSLHEYIPLKKEDGDETHPPKKDRIPAMVLGWDMAEGEYVSSEKFDVRIVFFDESPSNPIKLSGNLSLLVGAEIKSLQLKNESSAFFQNISVDYYGKQALLTLEDSKYTIDDLELLNLKFKKDEPLLVKVVFGKTYALPEEAKLDLTFKEGWTIEYGPQPNDKILTIILSAFSHSNYIIPIDRKAKLLLQDGTTYITELKNQDNIYLTPHEINDISFDCYIPKTILSRMITGSIGVVTIKYDNLYVKSDSTWTANFSFDQESIKEW